MRSANTLAPIMESPISIEMSDAEVRMLKRALKESTIYLEYGAGGSTRLTLDFANVSSIMSVESDSGFVDELIAKDPKMASAVEAGRLRFMLVDIGPTGSWGTPRDKSKEHLWPNYALCPFLHGHRPDLVLVDGRFRVASALVSAIELPEAKILIHDYGVRPNYWVLERFLEVQERADSLVACRRKRTIDIDEAKAMLRDYIYNPQDVNVSKLRKLRNAAFDFCARTRQILVSG